MERPLHEYATAELPITFTCVGCQRPIAVSRLEGHVLMNFVSSIQQFLAPALVNRMAASLGLGQGLATKAIQVAVPAILSGLARGSSKPIVVNQLARVLARQDSSLLRNYSSVIGSSSQQPLIEGGINALGAVFGSTSTSALTSAIGKYTGLNFNQSESLLGMIVPVVLGQLAQTQKSEGVDTEGLAQLIDAQKDTITAAIPNGFAKLLETTGLIEPIAKDSAEAAPNVPELELLAEELPVSDLVEDSPVDVEPAAITEPAPTFESQPIHAAILDTSELIPPRPALPVGALAGHDEDQLALTDHEAPIEESPLAEEPGVIEPIISDEETTAEEETVTEPSIAATLLPGTEWVPGPASEQTPPPFAEPYDWSPDVPPSVDATVQPEGIDYDPPVIASPTVHADAGPATALPKERSEPLVITPTTISRPSVEATLLETAPSRTTTPEPEPIATSRAEPEEASPPAPQRLIAPEPPPEAKPEPAPPVAPPVTSSSVPPIPAPKPETPPNLPPVSQVAQTASSTSDGHEKPAQAPRKVSPVWPEEPRPSRALGVLKRFVLASIVLGGIGLGGYALHDHVTKLQATQSNAPTAPAEATAPAEPAPVAAPAPTQEPTPTPADAPSTPPTDAAPEPAATPPSPEPETPPSETKAAPEAAPAPPGEPATPDAAASEPTAPEAPPAAPEAAASEASTDAPSPSSDQAPATSSDPTATEPTPTPSDSSAPAPDPATAPASEPEASAPTAADNEVVMTATSLLDSLSATLAGITDEASATAALPSLEANAREIEKLKTSSEALSPEQRQPLAALITETLPKLMKSIDTASQTSSSVNDIIKPVLDPMFANLDAMSKN